MNRGILFACILILLSCFGCNQQENARQEADRSGDTLYRDENEQTQYGYQERSPESGRNDTIRHSGQNEIGYFHVNPVNYDKNSVTKSPRVFIDRSILAKHIAQLVADLAQVKTATALVTDDHIFIGLQYQSKSQSKLIKKRTMKEAIRIAESVTPRYYKVHVTDRQKLENQLNQVGMQMQRNGDIEGIRGDLNQLLRQMGDTTSPG